MICNFCRRDPCAAYPDCQAQAAGEAVTEARKIIKRLLVWPRLHEQEHPEWNGNRFDDVKLAEEFLDASDEYEEES